MLVHEILSELRRNPTLNPKEFGHPAAVKFLQSLPKDQLLNYGVSMTEVPKLGINPQSSYMTPLGIYFYDAAYYLQRKARGREMEFQDEAPYIQIFKYKSTPLVIDLMERDAYTKYVKEIFEHIDEITKMLGMSKEAVTKRITDALLNAQDGARIKNYGGMFWYVLWATCGFGNPKNNLKSKSADKIAERGTIVWNRIFRLLNIDIIIDDGEGIIHPNEKNQGVVINPAAIEHIETIYNAPQRPPEEIDFQKQYNMTQTKLKAQERGQAKGRDFLYRVTIMYTIPGSDGGQEGITKVLNAPSPKAAELALKAKLEDSYKGEEVTYLSVKTEQVNDTNALQPMKVIISYSDSGDNWVGDYLQGTLTVKARNYDHAKNIAKEYFWKHYPDKKLNSLSVKGYEPQWFNTMVDKAKKV